MRLLVIQLTNIYIALCLGVQLVIASPRWRVLHKLKRAKLDEKMKKENIFMTVGEAVDIYVRARSTSHDMC